jgi:isoleucyl-tRNA synthetase
LNRKRYWGGGMSTDKLAAYQTLYSCLLTVAKLSGPIAPFYGDKLYRDLMTHVKSAKENSVHLSEFPMYDEKFIDKSLEERMDIAQKATSMILALRRKVNIKVRQPLGKIMIPVLNEDFGEKLLKVKDLILSEVNVKEMELLTETTGVLVKKIKPDFKVLGPKFGKSMKVVASEIVKMSQENIQQLESTDLFEIDVEGQKVEISLSDVEITSEDIPGWLVATEGAITVALDINISESLHYEGIARELINRIQNIRKESGFEVTDKIHINLEKQEMLDKAVEEHREYISSQTLALTINFHDQLEQNNTLCVEIDNNISTHIQVIKA